MRSVLMLAVLSTFSTLAMAQAIPTPGSVAQTAHAPPAQAQGQASTTPAVVAEIPPLPPLPEVGPEAFNRMKQEAAPLTPEQIRSMARMMEEAERAAAAPPRYTPKAVSSSVVANLAPGATPPVVRLFANHVTTVVFMDQLGNPLSIRAVDLGAPEGFTLTHSAGEDGKTSFISLSPKSLYAGGNVVVALEGVSAPVALTLISGQREVDYRVDVRVRGVTAKGVVQNTGLPGNVGNEAMSMLGGFTPEGAKALRTSSDAVQAWSMGDRFYVRTPSSSTLLSPAHLEMVKAPDGSAVYVIPPTPVLMLLAGNDTASVSLSGY